MEQRGDLVVQIFDLPLRNQVLLELPTRSQCRVGRLRSTNTHFANFIGSAQAVVGQPDPHNDNQMPLAQ